MISLNQILKETLYSVRMDVAQHVIRHATSKDERRIVTLLAMQTIGEHENGKITQVIAVFCTPCGLNLVLSNIIKLHKSLKTYQNVKQVKR